MNYESYGVQRHFVVLNNRPGRITNSLGNEAQNHLGIYLATDGEMFPHQITETAELL